MYLFKHLLCSLCSIVNKILAHVIEKSFRFNLIQIEKTSQHFRNSGCRKLNITEIVSNVKHNWTLIYVSFHSKTHKVAFNCNIYSPYPAICKACWELTITAKIKLQNWANSLKIKLSLLFFFSLSLISSTIKAPNCLKILNILYTTVNHNLLNFLDCLNTCPVLGKVTFYGK